MSSEMFESKISEYKKEINTIFSGYVFGPKVTAIIDETCEYAAAKYTNAAYSGSMSDNGASIVFDKLKSFLIGVYYSSTGNMVYPPYKQIVDKKFDPEYAEFLRLSEKFKV